MSAHLVLWLQHYDAVMRYVSQGPMLMDVHMHKPNAISRNFMDALLAFWPGLQVLLDPHCTAHFGKRGENGAGRLDDKLEEMVEAGVLDRILCWSRGW